MALEGLAGYLEEGGKTTNDPSKSRFNDFCVSAIEAFQQNSL